MHAFFQKHLIVTAAVLAIQLSSSLMNYLSTSTLSQQNLQSVFLVIMVLVFDLLINIWKTDDRDNMDSSTLFNNFSLIMFGWYCLFTTVFVENVAPLVPDQASKL